MELWDLYNERRELLGRDLVRGEAIPDGCYHLVVHVWIIIRAADFFGGFSKCANLPAFSSD